MSDQIQNPAPGPALAATSEVIPAVQAGSPGQAAPAVAPAAEAPKAKAAPRPLNPYAAKVQAPKPVADPRIAALEASNAEHLSTLSTYASAELAGTSESVRNAVRAIAGDNPAAQLKALAALRANGLGAPVLTPGATTGATPKAAPKPAAVKTPDADAYAQYQHLKSKGAHIAASQFRSKNAAAIAKAEAAESNN